jgi:hypothetical protein
MTVKTHIAQFGRLCWRSGEAGDPCWYARLGGSELRARALSGATWIVGVRHGAAYDVVAVGGSFGDASRKAEEVLA